MKQLKRVRLKYSWTQEQIAKYLGVARKSVVLWENGRTTPPCIKRLLYYIEKEMDSEVTQVTTKHKKTLNELLQPEQVEESEDTETYGDNPDGEYERTQ